MVRIRVLSLFRYLTSYLCSNYQKGSAARDRWGFDKLWHKFWAWQIWSNVSSELTWQHTRSGFKTSKFRKRRWDQELGLVPDADITSPASGRICGFLLSLPAPTNGKAAPKTDACLSTNPFFSFLHLFCWLSLLWFGSAVNLGVVLSAVLNCKGTLSHASAFLSLAVLN